MLFNVNIISQTGLFARCLWKKSATTEPVWTRCPTSQIQQEIKKKKEKEKKIEFTICNA